MREQDKTISGSLLIFFNSLIENISNKLHSSLNISKDDIDLRLRAQWPVKLKSELADISIQNNGTKEDLKKTLKTWFNCLNKESAL